MSKILICDDEASILSILEFTLVTEGYQVVTARDGDEALAMAAAEDPDLIVLDVMMPRRNGVEVCHLLKSGRDTAHIPVVLLTAKGRREDREAGQQAGADSYIAKPFSPQRLVERIQSLLGVRKG